MAITAAQTKPQAAVRSRQGAVAAPQAPDNDVVALLARSKSQIAAALPKHLSADRMARIATTEFRKNPELMGCDPVSFIGAVIQAAQIGLEPGSALGHAYLVPFWNSKTNKKEVQLIPGYRGLIDLARRSGQIESISARVVYERDIFEFEYGLNEKLVHIPAQGDDIGDMTYVYAVAKLKGGGHQFEVMSREQVMKFAKNSGPWKTHLDEMARKTVIRRLFKYLPVSIEIAQAIELDNSVEEGQSQGNAQILFDAGVEPWQPEVTTPTQIDQAAAKDVGEQQRLDVLDRVEKKIAARMQGGQEARDIEQLIDRPLDSIADMKLEQLLAVYEVLK